MRWLLLLALLPALSGCTSVRQGECPPAAACAAQPAPAWLVHDAHKFAVSLGDPHPRVIRVTLDRFDKVTMHGRFVCTKCFGLWKKPPAGTVAIYVIGSRTRLVSSFYLHR